MIALSKKAKQGAAILEQQRCEDLSTVDLVSLLLFRYYATNGFEFVSAEDKRELAAICLHEFIRT